MTARESEILRKLIDMNWEFTQEKDVNKKMVLASLVNKLRNDLRDSMGEEEYDRFISNGQKMFAQK